MRYVATLLVGVLCVAGVALAQPPGKGSGRDESLERKAERAAERVAGEAIDAVGDELAGPSARSGRPPGLSKKDAMPPGLAKKDKVPPGWEKGKKTGWDGEPKKESLVRRIIRGIFRRSKPSDAPNSKGGS
jgi:hypothetical protein